MADTDHKQAETRGQKVENNELIRALDAALAKYAAVEPRAGLEERVLANLRAERAKSPDRGWWRWTAVAALAAVAVVAVALTLRSGRPTQPVAVKHILATAQSPREPERYAANGEANLVRPRGHQPVHRTLAPPHQPKAVVAAAVPKLDQFPSPQPLSEQERILKSYVAKYPEQAVLIARAASEARRQDQLEEMRGLSGDRATDSEEPNNGTTER